MRYPLRLTCARGLMPYLKQETEALGFTVEREDQTGVEVRGTIGDARKLNLWLRTAYAVMLEVKTFRAKTSEQLYQILKTIPWEKWLANDGYLTVESAVSTPAIDNTMFANVKVKDAIVDRIQQRTGSRPDSGGDRSRSVLFLYWRDRDCKIYLNTSGLKLSDRGYRMLPHKAPLRETLAAGILSASGYDGTQPLVCPMCGSGTLAIEGAAIALGRAPGLLRDNYGFMHMLGHDEAHWNELRRSARLATKKKLPAPILATDLDPSAINAARNNAKTAGVDHLIDFKVCDFRDTPVPTKPGIMVVNPEYGERLGEIESLMPIYKALGDFMKQKCTGYECFVFTGSRELAKHIGLHARRKTPFWNGNLECRLFAYSIYSSSPKS